MADKNLIRGAALVGASKRTNWAESFQKGLNNSLAAYEVNKRRKKAAKDTINAKTASYINSLNSEIDLSELTGEQQGAITNYLVKKRNEYAQAASRIARIEDPASSEYMQMRDQMNGVQLAFNNLAKQLGAYKQDKAAYLQEFDKGMLSEGNELNVLNEAADIYTDKGIMGVNEGGGLVFWNEENGNYNSYNDVQKPFLKDFKTADGILQMNESIYSSGAPLSGARRNMIRQKLNNMISQGGRDTLLSLASDDFIVEGGLGLQDPELLAKENEAALKQAVLDGYMGALEDSARQGYADKQARSRSASGRGRTALDQEIAASGNVHQDALEFAKLAGFEAASTEEKAGRIATELNSLDPTGSGEYVSRGQAYNDWLDSNDLDADEESAEQFRKLYPRSFQLFYYGSRTQKPEGVNINDPMSLYELYINNSNLSKKAKNYIITNVRNNAANTEQPTEETNQGGAYDNL